MLRTGEVLAAAKVEAREVCSNEREHIDRALDFVWNVLNLNKALPAVFVLVDDQAFKGNPTARYFEAAHAA